MKKYFPHVSAFIFTLALVFAVSGFLFPQTAHADWFGITNMATDILLAPLGWMAIFILQLASLITALSGFILNYVVKFTVVDMAINISRAGSINTAWGAIRDIANMGFIFVLLYAAIQTILGIGSDTKKLIVNIIVVAILINFSLFFTKVVIDASNVLAIAFYEAMAPESLSITATTGLSDILMQPLKIQSIWDTKNLGAFEGKNLMIIGIMGTIVTLIAAFVFFAVAIMFVIRFVVLIFTLILSPLAFMGFILPQLKKYKDQWWEALSGQAFFAPIYLMLTWIVIIVSRGLFTTSPGGDMATALVGVVGADGNVTPPPLDSIALLVNFIIMIVLLIASLIIAKEWANKAGHGVPGLTKWAMGAAGSATLGVAGRFSRNTAGRLGQAVADSEGLKERAAKGGMGGIAARLALATGRKTGAASFDIRGTALGGPLEAGKAQKGGFTEVRKRKAEREAKFAEALAPSAKAQAKAERRYNEASGEFGPDSRQAFQAKIRIGDMGKGRKESFAKTIENSYWAKAHGYNYDAAARIRKGKPAKDRAVDILKDLQKEGTIPEEEKPETPPSTLITPPTPPTP